MFSQGYRFLRQSPFRINGASNFARHKNVRPVRQLRQLTLSPRAAGALRGYGTIVNIFAGAYLGGLIACFGSLYFIYRDADSRQHIPFSLSFSDQILAVKAIGKDDVLQSPRHAVKHYRRILVNLAKRENPDLDFAETLEDGSRNYAVPILPVHVLVSGKNTELANFYIDILLRYSKALLAKGELAASLHILKSVIDNDDLFYRLGDAERMAQCCRVVSRVSPDAAEREFYLHRSVDMLEKTFANIRIDEQYLLQDHTALTDELVASLNALAFMYAQEASTASKRAKDPLLSQALNIYLANLKVVSQISEKVAAGGPVQAAYPLFDCGPENLQATVAEIKAHVAEILWAKGYKKKAVAWGEEVVQETFYDQGHSAKVSAVLVNTLDNLIVMYGKLRDTAAQERCQAIKRDVNVVEYDTGSYYTSVLQRFTKVIYYRGPLGIIEKVLKERFGPAQPLPELEEFEDEDEE